MSVRYQELDPQYVKYNKNKAFPWLLNVVTKEIVSSINQTVNVTGTIYN